MMSAQPQRRTADLVRKTRCIAAASWQCTPVGSADDDNALRAGRNAVKLHEKFGLQPPAGLVLAGAPL
jgi:hypothetical protein